MGAGIGGTITISGIPGNLAVVAADAACPTLDCAPIQLCPLQSQGSSRSQSVKRPKWNPRYIVQCCSNTGSLISRPLSFLATSAEYRFEVEEQPDCSQTSASKGFSSKVAVSVALILWKAFKRLGSKTRQGILVRSNKFVWEVQLLSYVCIQTW